MIVTVLHDIAAGTSLAFLVHAVWTRNLAGTLLLVPITWVALTTWITLHEDQDEAWR